LPVTWWANEQAEQHTVAIKERKVWTTDWFKERVVSDEEGLNCHHWYLNKVNSPRC
jgi:hypothetical protein